MRNTKNFRLNVGMFVYVFAMMMLCANSSPLYNTMVTDSAGYRVMGRALAAGKIMYKEVFDHKGLYVYVINALGVILNDKSLLGLFVIECVFMFLCARIIFALLSLYADEKTSLIGTQIFILFALFRGIFTRGNLTEEYGLLFQILAVYLLVKDGGNLTCLHMFLQGVLVGIMICLRTNIAMMWGGIAIVAGCELLRRKNFALLAGNVAAGILGVMAGVMPAMIYAVMNDAVSDMLFGMFGYNMLYIGAGKAEFLPVAILRRVLLLLKPHYRFIDTVPVYIIMLSVAVSCVVMLKRSVKSRLTTYYFAMLAMTLVSVSLSGRNYGYYYESLVPFCVPLSYWLASKVKPEKYRLAMIIVMIAVVVSGLKFPDSIRVALGRKVFSPGDFVRANEPYKSENERVLVTGNNSIFYDILGVVPQEKYFYIPLDPYDAFPKPRDSQIASILSGVNDVIIIAYSEKHEIFPETGRSAEIQSYLDKNYDLLHHDAATNITMYGRKL